MNKFKDMFSNTLKLTTVLLLALFTTKLSAQTIPSGKTFAQTEILNTVDQNTWIVTLDGVPKVWKRFHLGTLRAYVSPTVTSVANSTALASLTGVYEGDIAVNAARDTIWIRDDSAWIIFKAGTGGGSSSFASLLASNPSAGGSRITNLGTPTAGTDAATKNYVDSKVLLTSVKPTVFSALVVVDTVGIDSVWLWNTSVYRLLQTGSSGVVSSTCEQTFTQTAHGFSPRTPLVWSTLSSTWVRPTNDTVIPTYVVVDSISANIFKVANCGTYATTLASGLYYFTGTSPGYTLTPGVIKTPLFEVAQGRLIFQPFVGLNLTGGGVTDGNKTDITVLGNTWTVNAGVINNSKLATNAVDSTKAVNLSPTDLAQTGANVNDVLTWVGSKYAPRPLPASQAPLQFKDEGTNLGAQGTVTAVDVTGAGATASRSGNTVTINVPGSGVTSLVINSNTTASPGVDLYLSDTSTGSITVTISPGAFTNRVLHVKKITNNSNNVTITPSSGTIDGSPSYTLFLYNEVVTIFSNGTNLYML